MQLVLTCIKAYSGDMVCDKAWRILIWQGLGNDAAFSIQPFKYPELYEEQ